MKNILKPVVAFLFLTCVIFTGCSQRTFDNALLWKVSGKDLNGVSYIFGTHHLINIAFLDSVSGLEEAFNATEQVVGELVISPETMAEMQSQMLHSAAFAVGDGYKKILSPEDYKRLDKGLKAVLNKDISSFERLKPGFISIMIAQMTYSMVDVDFNPVTHEALDAYVQRIARDEGKPTLGLETIKEQVSVLFESESIQKQSEMLICGLENMEAGKEMIVALNSSYKERSLSKIYNFSFLNENNPCPVSLRQLNALNRDRNRKWLKIIPGIMKDRPSFIAVGALHLAGEDGLLYQLDRMGYTVEAVD